MLYENKSVKRVHLDNFHIAGFNYWDGWEAFECLKIGSKLELVREEDNHFDPYAVAIYNNEHKLGFIPRGHNHDSSKFLDMGLGEIYEVRISRITPDVHPENQVEVILYVKKPEIEIMIQKLSLRITFISARFAVLAFNLRVSYLG